MGIAQLSDGKIIFLEEGKGGKRGSGFNHILENHQQEFATRGLSEADLPDAINAVTQGEIVGYQKPNRPIYKINFNGRSQLISVTVADNGYIVCANPRVLCAAINDLGEKKMTEKIKLMPDYCCSPLWGIAPDNIGNIDPEKLPLSLTTLHRLKAYSEAYEADFNWDDPPESPEPTEAEIDTYEPEGISLWLQLRENYPQDSEVHFIAKNLRKLSVIASELMAAASVRE